jgi:hypothetical protein
MKKKYFFIFIFLCIYSFSYAQIEFKRVSHHFGEVEEMGGEVSVEFEYNNGNLETKIIMVQPSCGCTTPEWKKEAILPNEKGKITVKFAPKGRLGEEFSKNVTVMTNFNQVFWLKIEGVVVAKKSKKLE